MQKKTRTRSQLVIDVTLLVVTKYPTRWNARELSIMTGANLRTINRVLAEMTESGLLERKYHTYSLPLSVANQFYGAQWYVKQEMDKDIMIHNKGAFHGKEKSNQRADSAGRNS